jgi:hypothetical protein
LAYYVDHFTPETSDHIKYDVVDSHSMMMDLMKMRSGQTPSSSAKVILYPTPGGSATGECRFSGGTVWLTRVLMAALFEKMCAPSTSTPSKPIRIG